MTEQQDTHIEGLADIVKRLGIADAGLTDEAVINAQILLADPAILAHIPAVKALQEEVERLAMALKGSQQLREVWEGRARDFEATNAAQAEQLRISAAAIDVANRKVSDYSKQIDDLELTLKVLYAANKSSIPPEPQAGVELTDEEVLFEADNYSLLYGGNQPELLGFARTVITADRALNQRQADKPLSAAQGVPEAVKLAMIQAHGALESEYRTQTRATEAQRVANATCGQSPGGASGIALLAESAYISSLGKKNIAARDALFAALRDYPVIPAAQDPEESKEGK